MTKAYPKYKQCPIAWIGNIPEDWNVIALKRISTRYSGGTPDRNNESYWDEGTIPWINSGEVNQKQITKASTYITEEAFNNSSAKWIPVDGLAMALAGQGKTKGMVAQTKIATTCNQSMAAIIPNEMRSSRYIFWSLESQYQEIRNMAGGDSRDGLNLEIVGNIPISMPKDLDEQKTIADYLDAKTKKIDDLIERKVQFIERLKEKRTALISQVVTKGLPPEEAKKHGLPEIRKMKSSGVDWLGDIPDHWNITKLKYEFRFLSGGTPNTENERFWNGDIPWVSPKDMKSFLLTETIDNITDEAIKSSATTLVPADTLLIVTRSGILRHTIPVGITTKPMAINQDLKAFKPLRNNHSSKFWAYFISSHDSELLSLWSKPGTTVESIETELAKNSIVPLPPYLEQLAIAEYLDFKTKLIDELTTKVRLAIEKLTQYRSTIITSAVTGKIDVRDFKESLKEQ